MKTLTPALQALLDSGQFRRCSLFTITFITGQMLFLTDAEIDVTADGQVYSSTGPSISGAKFHMVRGLQVDSLTLTVLAKDTDWVSGVTWSVAARSGALDGAIIKIDKAFLADWGQPAERVTIFTGCVRDAVDGEIDVALTVVSDDDKLNSVVPKLCFQPGCMRNLYASGCGVSRAAFARSGVVAQASSRSKFSTALSDPDGFFALGSVTFLSGLNAGVRRSVKSYVGGVVQLSNPLVFDLAAGDAFQIVAGCDKTQAMCAAKFNNLPNFKGTPYVPKPETMV